MGGGCRSRAFPATGVAVQENCFFHDLLWPRLFLAAFVSGRVCFWPRLFLAAFVSGRVCFWQGLKQGPNLPV
jgi:hypothetical protein